MNLRLPRNPNGLLPAAVALAMALSSSLAFTQDEGFYAGVSIGSSKTDVRRQRIAGALQAGGYTINTFSEDERDSAYKLLGGYSFNDNIAVEATYFDPGSFDFQAGLTPSAMQKGTASVRGLGVSLVGTWSLRDSLAAFVRAGLNSARVEQDFTTALAGTAFIDGSERGVHENYGIGLEYALAPQWALRLELERYRIDDNLITTDKVDNLSLGFLYRFGRSKPVAAPARQVEAAPTPAPAPVTAPTLPLEVTLSASTLFDFDRAELKPEGRRELDKLVGDMSGLNYEVVIVTGHTDRIGTRSYNLALSQRRADTVKNYLTAAGIPEEFITTRGVNSDQPVTRPGQCSGPVSDALKACLQPDRRVVVEVTGSREAP